MNFIIMKKIEGKKMLILGATSMMIDMVKQAQAMGVYVVVADYKEDSPAKKYANEAILLNATNVDEIVEYCRKNNIDGITTGFVDVLLEPCYDACKRLGIPYYATPKMITMSTDKIDFKETCIKYDIPVPKTYLCDSTISNELFNVVQYPVFVKPQDASGSRGAAICNSKEELINQFNIAKEFSISGNVIVEDCLVGTEFLLNYIGQDGEFRLISLFDRYKCEDRGSFMNFSNIAIAPSLNIENYLNNMNEKVINMFKSLGFKDGLIFLQGFFNDNKITFYEMGCRLGGSYTLLEKACLGCDTIDMMTRYALTGTMVDDIYKFSKDSANYSNIAVTINYLLKGSKNKIVKIIGINEIKAMSSVVGTEQLLFEGDEYSFEIDKTFDRAIFSVHLVVSNKEQLIRDVNYMHGIFDVINENGESIVSMNYDPSILY